MEEYMQRFRPEPGLEPTYAQGYSLKILEEGGDTRCICMVTSDRDQEDTAIVFTTQRAREIARALTGMADDIDSRSLRVGDSKLTKEQLEDLPVGAVLSLGPGRTAFKREAEYYCWVTSNGSEISSFNVWFAIPDAKIAYLPEETE